MLVYVLDRNGQPLMPTHNGAKVRVLLKQKRAKVVSKYFVAGRMSTGLVYLIDIDNNRPQVERTKRNTGEKYMSKAKIKVSLVKKLSSTKTCICTCIQ